MTTEKQILVVDDEPAIVRITARKLEQLGYLVTETINPIEALYLVKVDPRRFDLLITDMVMPDMSGIQLAQKVLEIAPDLPIILFSGYCTLSSEDVNRIGIRKFLTKPVNLNSLAHEVEAVLTAGADAVE